MIFWVREGEGQLRIQVNGEARNVTDQLTLSDLLDELSLAPARVAIELNGEVVRRSIWAETVLNEGDRLEVVHFVGGGSEGNRRPEFKLQLAAAISNPKVEL